MKRLTRDEIRDALENGRLHVTVNCDYQPSLDLDKAAYQDIEFTDRAWRNLVLAATKRAKMSRQLDERQVTLARRRTRSNAGDLTVRVLTLDGALNLQDAGYRLEYLPGCSYSLAETAHAGEKVH